MHQTEIRKYAPANLPKNLQNNPPKTKLIISQKNIPENHRRIASLVWFIGGPVPIFSSSNSKNFYHKGWQMSLFGDVFHISLKYLLEMKYPQ